MADGNLVRQSNVRKGSMVFGPTVYDVPLLPFEKQLIEAIGITEEEYRAFTAEAKRRGAVRPAAYDHIPDVQATGLEPGAIILINLAISLVLTGVSYLLTPKPKMPKAGGGVIDLGSIAGANRFTPSRGFETLAELADYASPVPLIFGLYKDNIGGMLTTPKLVWSRMFSHGTMQRAKLMFVVGEQGVGSEGIQPPDLKGIFLGNNALDAVFNDYFAFYWHADSSSTFRIRGSDKRYGTRGKPHRGDPDVSADDGDAFNFPLSEYDQDASEIFCHAYTPSNSAQFGVYGSIANGTSYRVNYQLISIPENDNDRAVAIRMLERIKIVGDSGVEVDDKILQEEDEEEGVEGAGTMPGDAERVRLIKIYEDGKHDGAGRNYSPRMGITKYTKKDNIDLEDAGTVTGDGEHRLQIASIAVGDQVEFVISDSSIDPEFYIKNKAGQGATVDDINSTVESFQIEADSTMQLGEHFEIGGCIWKVITRNRPTFEPSGEIDGGNNQIITLECVDVSTSINKNIGIVSNSLVVAPISQFIGDSGIGDKSRGIGEAFFPLTQVEIATIKNNRPAVSTEIGLKSTVFQRLNGLCNFQSLPSPESLRESEKDRIQMNSGTISTSVLRSSMFRVFLRDISLDSKFNPLPQIFVVQGVKPIAQYNYIRFTLDRAVELEYKFVPVSGSEIKDLSDTQKFIVLSQLNSTGQPVDGSHGSFEFEATVSDAIGLIRVHVSGREITGPDFFKRNKEFTRGPKTVTGNSIPLKPETVIYKTNRPEPELDTVVTTNSVLKREKNIANDGITESKLAAFFYTIAGTADDEDVPPLGKRFFESVEYINGSTKSWIHVQWHLQKAEIAEVAPALDWVKGQEHFWRFPQDEKGIVTGDKIKVLGSGGGFYGGQEIEIKRGSQATNVISGQAAYPSTNPFVFNHPDSDSELTDSPVDLLFSGCVFSVKDATENVVLGDRNQAWRYEVFGSTEGFEPGHADPNQDVETIGDLHPGVDMPIVTQDGKSIKVRLTANCKQFKKPIVGQLKGWGNPIATVIDETIVDEDENEVETTTTGWEVGDQFGIFKRPSVGNPFQTVYDRIGQIFEITKIDIQGAPAVTDADLFFAEQTQVSDISFYRSFVDKSNSTSPEHEIVYVNEAQLNDSPANMFELTIAGLSLKASRNFTALDQMRCWLGSGLPVERLHPNLGSAYVNAVATALVAGTVYEIVTVGTSDFTLAGAATNTVGTVFTATEATTGTGTAVSTIGPSNLFTDLVYFLLTDQRAGAGGLLGMDRDNDYLVDKNDLVETSKFLVTQKLFFNGPIVERTNLRQFISDIAPYFLCNFIISDGKFSLKPAVPVNDDGTIKSGLSEIPQAVEVSQLFTAGNIIEDSYKLEYLGAEERRAFKAVVRYRQERKNKLPEEQVVEVRNVDGTGDFDSPGITSLPAEQFDLTQFCTSEDHAVKVAKYFLALRAYVTHTISFSTTAEGLSIQAGSYIKVITESSPYSAANTGTVDSSGTITSVVDMPDGLYDITYFKVGDADINSDKMNVANGAVENSAFHNIVFTVQNTKVSENIYIVEQLTFSQDGIVDIVASEHPCNPDLSSKIATAVDSDTGFKITS